MTSTPAATLYHFPPTRSNRALWAIEELGLDVRRVEVNLFRGEQRQPSYLQVHPQGVVPALALDGAAMFESAAIVLRLVEQHPESGLAPPLDSPLRAAYLQWAVFGPAELDPHLVTLNHQTRLLPPPARRPELAEQARQDLRARFGVLEGVLGERPFLLGQHFSAADIIIGHACAWARMIEVLDAHRILIGYLDRLQQRPAFQRAYGPRVEVFPDPHAGSAH